MKAISATQMRMLDSLTIESGTSGQVLMERAGCGAADEVIAFVEGLHPSHRRRFVVVAGKGNNGGDGFVIARRLAKLTSLPTLIVLYGLPDQLAGESRINYDRLPEKVTVVPSAEWDSAFESGDVIIDCLLGTGISGTVREPYAGAIRDLNGSGLPIVSIDVPSGLDSDTGEAAGIAVNADFTITIGLPKTGLFAASGLKHRGILRVVRIGIPESFVTDVESKLDVTVAADVRPHLARIPVDRHKGSMGKILVIGGSVLYPGALILAGSGALRAGGGLVFAVYPGSVGPVMSSKEHALIRQPLPDSDLGYHRLPVCDTDFRNLVDDKHVILVGPGLGRHPETESLVVALLKTKRSVVLDADALAVFGQDEIPLPRSALTVITPHPGEMKRLLNNTGIEIDLDCQRQEAACRVARDFGVYVVLKGPATIVAAPDGRFGVNSTGTAALATGGTGDVLAGMITAFLCQIDDPYAALRTAVFVHGLAAELSPYGMRNLTADGLLDLIGPALATLTPFA